MGLGVRQKACAGGRFDFPTLRSLHGEGTAGHAANPLNIGSVFSAIPAHLRGQLLIFTLACEVFECRAGGAII
jgi:hypothetical protein